MEKIIRDLLKNFEGVSYIDCEDSGEGKLFSASVDYLDTLDFDEDIYKEWEELLNSIQVIGDNYQIYCSYDCSGFDYWNNRQEESNYTYIDIWLSDDFSDEDIDKLYNSLVEVYNKIDNFYFKYF